MQIFLAFGGRAGVNKTPPISVWVERINPPPNNLFGSCVMLCLFFHRVYYREHFYCSI